MLCPVCKVQRTQPEKSANSKTHNRVLSLSFEESGDISVDMEKPILEPAHLPFVQTEDSLSITAR